MTTPSQTVQAAQQLLAEREVVGLAKYGTTVDRTDLTKEQWLQHLIEELADGLLYALRARDLLRTAAAGQLIAEVQPSPAQDKALRIAPWPDFAGNPIREGDWIARPSGERACHWPCRSATRGWR